MVRLSTAQRINQARDDAAGQAIANTMQSELRSTDQASRNVADGLSLTGTADAALKQAQDVVQRMRELSLQAANGSTSQTDRQAIQQEIAQLNAQLKSMANNTEFNGQKLFDGQFRAQIQSGTQAGDSTPISLNSVSPEALKTANLDVTQNTADDNLRTIDQAIEQLNSDRAGLGAAQGALASRQASLRGVYEKLSSAKSRIADTDYAKEASDLQSKRLQETVAMKALALYKSNAAQVGRLVDRTSR